MKLLFIINRKSGGYIVNWQSILKVYFFASNHEFDTCELDFIQSKEQVKKKIAAYQPDRVIAVGGDGTVNLVAGCLLYTGIALCIVPAGSANGMAKELQVPESATNALDLVTHGKTRTISVIQINNEYCIHLSDIGLNALMVLVFEQGRNRGKFGYLLAAIKVIFTYKRLKVVMRIDEKAIRTSAVMIVFANATRYGTGALINPVGKMNDDLFEVIVINKLSLKEIYKMMVSHMPFNPLKTKIYQTRSLSVHAKRKVHFQVDGECRGKVNTINAKILTDALEVIVPI